MKAIRCWAPAGFIVLAVGLFAACDKGDDADPSMGKLEEQNSYAVGGVVTGLRGKGLILENNGEELAVDREGSFAFDTLLEQGTAYNVTIVAQPNAPLQTCKTAHASGKVGSADISAVRVSCETQGFSVGGTVSGLTGTGLILRNNGGDDLSISSNGSFAFQSLVDDGANYSVAVHAQPKSPSQTCTVTNSSGVIGGVAVSSVDIQCVIDHFSVAGSLTGLEGTPVVLRNNGGDELRLRQNGTFAFADSLTDGSAYAVTVAVQPVSPSQTCSVTDGVGFLDGAPAGITVICQSHAQIRELTASRKVVKPGESVTLTWATRGITACELNPGGFVTPVTAGSRTSVVSAATTFVLTCQGYQGPASQAVTVQVTDTNWAQLSANNRQSCAIKADGRLFCWGYGRLGRNDMFSSSSPVQEETNAANWSQVSVGQNHSCAVKSDGRLYCWGWNIHGALGLNNTVDQNVPTQEYSQATDWLQVAVGRDHACAVKTNGRLYCWGDNGYAQLGTGTTTDSLFPVQESTKATDWAFVSAGSLHSCGLKTNGRLYCWGYGMSGQLGSNTTSWALNPVQVLEPLGAPAASDWASVSAGGSHSCAVKTDGRLFCWGSGDLGILGINVNEMRLVPTQEYTEANDWANVSAAYAHTCAVKTGGQVFCWGVGDNGRLGNNSGRAMSIPTLVSSLGGVSTVSGAGYHTCALSQDGAVRCWGENDYSQLGNGAFDRTTIAGPVESEITDWLVVATGMNSSCGIRVDGTLYCWGAGDYGVLGHNDYASAYTPVQEFSASADWADVAIGGIRTCGLKTDGRIFCWGRTNQGGESLIPVQEISMANDWTQVAVAMNLYGASPVPCAIKANGRLFCQVGSSTPTEEPSRATNWARIAMGGSHTCGLKTDGTVYCWGKGDQGQLGHGQASNSSVPVQESTLDANWTKVSAGASHTCGLKDDGRIFCWGANGNGQVGDGTTENVLEPLQEGSFAYDWVDVVAGVNYSCGLKLDGRIFCWGMGDYGSLGNGDFLQSAVTLPTQEITQSANWKKLSAYQQTCASKEDGRLFCWGYNSEGQLGTGRSPTLVLPAQ